MPAPIQHVFVLMLENRSFDHMFGFSGLSGVDAETGAPTQIEGLHGDESNDFEGTHYPVTRGASFVMPAGPGHEFPDILDQLCGPRATRYVPPYPLITRGGFVDAYVHTGGVGARANPAEIMKCFDTAAQLPVLYALAQEFAICDRWFSSLPGPTWPNRMFVHSASSGGLEHSPTNAETLEWELGDGFSFPKGTILDALMAKGIRYHVYSGDEFPMAAALKGVTREDLGRVDDLVADLRSPSFPYGYVFIEPSYDPLNEYRHGTSQHPLGDVRSGELLVKQVYEALRASAIWESSLLVIVWDEHGGFYDHAVPPPAAPPGDTPPSSKYNQAGFTFAQYGVRVPAIVVSPLIPRATIDHRVYDHASIPATLEALWGLGPLTARDAGARSVLPLLSLPSARETPMTLPDTAGQPAHGILADVLALLTRAEDSINADNLPSILHAAVRQDILLDPTRRNEILSRVAAISTRQEAFEYLKEVRARLRAEQAR